MLINKIIYCRNIWSFKLRNWNWFASGKGQKGKQSGGGGGKSKAPSKDSQGKQSKSGGKTPQKGKASEKGKTADKDKKQQQVMLGNIAPKKKQPIPQSVMAYFRDPTKANKYYRNILRIAQIRKRIGKNRAKFVQKTLLNVVDQAVFKDINLLFESYYNYLGNFTKISNTTVDTLLIKASKLGIQSSENKQQTYNKILEVISNHEYLGYFPHYQTTINITQYSRQINKFSTMLQILRNKIMIKLNLAVIKKLYDGINEWSLFVKLTKIICFRYNMGLIPEISKEVILGFVVNGIKNIEGIKCIHPGQQYTKFIEVFNQPSVEVIIARIVMYKEQSKAVQMLKNMEINSENSKILVEVINKLQVGQPTLKVKQNIGKLLIGTKYQKLLE